MPPPAMVVVPPPLLQGVSVDAAMLRPTCDQVLRRDGADGSMSTAVSPPPPPPTCTGGGKEGSRPNRGRPNGGGKDCSRVRHVLLSMRVGGSGAMSISSALVPSAAPL
ncbi:unnamed protein product [Ectocarpus sp. 12 AP-2014]